MNAHWSLLELTNMPPPVMLSVASPCTQNALFLLQSLSGARLMIACPSRIWRISGVFVRATASTRFVTCFQPKIRAKYVFTCDVMITCTYSELPALGPLMGGL